MQKVYMFYKRKETSPYAYTINQSYAELFQVQRNMDVMFMKKIEMNKYEFMIFANTNKNIQLIEDWLFDGENDISIISTIEESSILSEKAYYVLSKAKEIEKSLSAIPFKKKYLNSIFQITQEIIGTSNNNPTLRVDTFTLFYYLFRDTFSEVPVEYLEEKEN
jgi:hypothetical protein